MTKKYILAIGELLVDAISNVKVDDLSQAEVLNIHPGGSTGNFCRYLARCGTPSRLIATIGNDGFGTILLQKIARDGLSAEHIRRAPDHNTSMIVVGRTNGTPDFIPYRDADKCIETVPAYLLQGALMLHTTAFALSDDPARTTILNAFEEAHASNIPLSVDWNYSGKIWNSAADARAVFDTLQSYAPFVKFSLDDARRFAGTALSPAEALGMLGSFNTSFICLTCGSDGVYYRTAQEDWIFVAAEHIRVENATGAGDAFWAGFIHAWATGCSIADAVQLGVSTAGRKLQGKLLPRDMTSANIISH